MIHIENLKKYYGTFPAVDGISFDVAPGEILGFLGPNGAGKTTTMKVITGYYTPSEGRVEIDGRDVVSDSLATRQMIGYLPESNPLYVELTVYEYLLHIAEMRQIPKENRIDRIEQMASITGLTDRLGQTISKLSKGYRQRVGLAQAMLHDPKILILDEPTIGLDPNQIVEIRSLIKRLGKEKTVILSTHILSEVQATCDRVVIINRGKLIADGTTESLQNQFRGEPTIDLDIEAASGVDIKTLESIQGVTRIETLPDPEPGVTGLRIVCAPDTDLRRDIFKTCVDKKWTILTMKHEIRSLEDVFQQLTSDAEASTQQEEAA